MAEPLILTDASAQIGRAFEGNDRGADFGRARLGHSGERILAIQELARAVVNDRDVHRGRVGRRHIADPLRRRGQRRRRASRRSDPRRDVTRLDGARVHPGLSGRVIAVAGKVNLHAGIDERPQRLDVRAARRQGRRRRVGTVRPRPERHVVDGA